MTKPFEKSNGSDAIVPGNNAPPAAGKGEKPGLRGNPNLAELGKPYRWQTSAPSPNPRGRPKTPLTDTLRKGLARVDKNGLTVAENMAEAQIQEALAGSLPHFHEIVTRVDGPPVQQAGGTTENIDALGVDLVAALFRIGMIRRQDYHLPDPEVVTRALAYLEGQKGDDDAGDPT